MTFDSETALKSHVRGQVGVKQKDDLPEQTLDAELERGKQEVNAEMRERLNNEQSLDFYDSNDSDQKTLVYFLLLRARVHVIRNQKKRTSDSDLPDVSDAPKSIASIRRYDFGDTTLNHWRDRMVTHLNNITV